MPRSYSLPGISVSVIWPIARSEAFAKVDWVALICESAAMKTLVEAIQVADQLTSEDQAGLAAHLLAGLRGCPLGPDDVELERREAEVDADSTALLTHEQLRQAVGR